MSATSSNNSPLLAILEAIDLVDSTVFNAFSAVCSTLAPSDPEGASLSYGLEGAVAADASFDGLHYDLSKAGTYGILYLNSSTGAYRFEPNSNWNLNTLSASGTDSFNLTVSDGTLTSSTPLLVNFSGSKDAQVQYVLDGSTTPLNARAEGIWEQALANASNYLSNLLSDPNRDALFADVFGRAGTDPATFAANLQALLATIGGDGMQIAMDLRSDGELGGAIAAYAAISETGLERIYVNADKLNNGSLNVNMTTSVLLEEIAHAMDRRLNGGADSPGDEGALFAAEVTGITVTAEQRALIDAEDDIALLTIDGVQVLAEQATDITTDIITEAASAGSDTVQSSVTYILGANLENLTLTGTAAINGTGNTLDNVITGNEANNILNGGAGIDTLIGGAGDDTYSVDSTTDIITEAASAGSDTVLSSVTYTLGANLENLTLTGTAAINGTGNTLNNVITGNGANNILDGGAGHDTLIGGAGIDTLIGGLGDDIYSVDSITDIITEAAGAGSDTVQSSVTYTLGVNLENLTLTGIAAINGTGNTLDNVITGNAANNILDGGTGIDTLIGGLGNDTYSVDSTTDIITEAVSAGSDTVQSSVTYTLGANLENLSLTGTAAINGTGNTLNNVITGNGANNTLDGGAGIDTLIGGLGDDTYSVDSTTDIITEAAGAGSDTVLSSVTYTLGANLENLTLTGIAAINGTGNTLNNVISGNGANNILNGGAGIDTLIGGAGDDTYSVDSATDIITEDLGAGSDTVQSSVTYTLGANLENLTLTGTAAINGTGNTLNNVITGNGANNILNGGAGIDTLIGGLGNDTYSVDSTTDIITEAVSAGSDTVQSSVTYTLGANLENLSLTGTAAINGTGNTLNNVITGNGANNTLDGGAGIDTLIGGLGDDTYSVDSTTDIITEAAGAGSDTVLSSVTYTLGANLENLTLTGIAAINGTGNTLNNVISGNGANNILNGGAGIDTLIGGAGDDTYSVDSATDIITEDLGAGSDTVQSSVTYTLGANLENLTLTGIAAINGTGNTLDNVITGNGANNILDGGAGIDTLIGGLGNDTYSVDSTTDTITETASAGSDTVQSSVTYTLGANLENLTLTGTAAINGTGNTLNNVISGNGANNTLDGGAGIDTLIGGLGNDTYSVDSTTDTITEAASAGSDTVQSSVTYTLGANLENLTLTGTAAINGTGNTLDNVITGNEANNILNGGAGIDTLIGGLGNDTYSVDSATDIITEDLDAGSDTVLQSWLTYTLGANLENLTLTGIAAISGTGNTLDNVITGNGANNVLYGLEGNDTLDGGAGIDTLIGDLGNDTYSVDSTTDIITEDLDAGSDTVQSSVTYTLGVNLENLTLTGIAAINGSGNTLNNVITGNAANNILDGGAGIDTLIGGLGNDTYSVDSTTDTITEAASAGSDTVRSSVTYILGANLENLTLTGTAASNGTGNTLNNVITGNGANNTLDGGSGNDTLIGGLGNDTYSVDSASDIITETASAGSDTVQSSVTYTLDVNLENLTLTGTAAINGTGNTLDNVVSGNEANNILGGGSGSDTLIGGAGIDTLIGGLGNDTYSVDSTTDIITEAASEGSDTVQSSVTYILGTNLENLTLTGTAAISGTGNTLDNVITGNGANNILDGGSGNDTLIGGLGNDTLIGGLGNDTYSVDSTTDIITEDLDAGSDTVLSSVTYTLDVNLENLTLTGTAAINGTGNTLDNVISGNEANNILGGGTGIDTLIGGLGNDTYSVDSTTDTITEAASAGSDTVLSSVTYTLGANLENLTLTGTAAINGTGNTLDNVITGNGANNILNGGAGIDTLIGGAGDDTYSVDSATDIITEDLDAGSDTVQSSVTYTLGVNLENLTLTGIAAINGTGNTLDNVITGNGANNILDGGAGIDTLIGGLGNDTYSVDSTTDTITETASAGSDTVQSSVTYTLGVNLENLTLTGTAAINGTGNTLNNVITGNGANNTLDGGAGIDTLIGGLGDDTYSVDSTTDIITEAAGAGSDTVLSSVTYTLGANLENLTLTGIAAINGTGNTLNNVISGNGANNILNGGAGIDTLIGGAGDDTYSVDSATDIITEDLGAGSDTVQSSVTYTLGVNLENLTLTGTAAISGTGNTLDNVIAGNGANNTLDGDSGNDTLIGGLGNDTLIGGLGDDTYSVDSTTDIITEAASAGSDTVQSSVTYTLGVNLENLTLTGTASISGTGNTLDNVITGNGANNILDGGAGIDTLIGGLGNDTYSVDSTTDIITEAASAGSDTVLSSVTYTLGVNLENLTLTGTAAINGNGNSVNNVLTGNSGNNSLYGLDGNDTLDGGAGIDTLIGGLGDDTYSVDSTTDTITEDLDAGSDTVQSSVTYTLAANLENLTLTGTAAINGNGNSDNNVLTGNSGDNSLYGLDGNDTLDGGAGIDTLIGDLGNDTYSVDSTTDIITEAASAGSDTVQSSVTYTLGVNLENLTLTGTASISGTGNTLDNVITGNEANNILDGGAGIDTLIGGLGNDTYSVDSTTDVITEDLDAGSDTVQSSVTYTLGVNLENLTLTGTAAINGNGNSDNNVLTGNSGDNSLYGLDGNDTLDGDAGIDTLIGGLGNDTYSVDSTTDIITEDLDAGSDTVQSSVTYILGANLENLTLTDTAAINGTGNTLDNVITGNGANNMLYGLDGNDTLDGGAGIDTLIGGLGNDTYSVDSATDIITEAASAGSDTIQSSVTYILGVNLENLTLTGTAAINGTGNTLDNVITGNEANNTLDGGAGNDTLIGDLGNDTYSVDSTTDIITEGLDAGSDTVESSVTYTLGDNLENLTLTGTAAINGTGNTLDNVITGNGANNTLDGGSGNDTLIGGLGNDTLVGGLGNDTYSVDSTTDIITETASAGSDTVQSSVTYTLGANLENLTLTGTAAINGTGNTLNNVISGNGANNILDGGAGIDTLIGGLGNDTYSVDSTTDVITEDLGAGSDTVQSSVSYILGDNLENLTLTGTAAINGTGNTLGNVLTGNGANNTLDGGAGIDTLIGGLGNDTYSVDSATDIITEAASAGSDTIQSSVTYTLGANLESLILTGTDAIDGTGNTLDNVITGNGTNNTLDGGAGNDTLIGGDGIDTLIGGLGNDTYSVDSTSDTITETASAGSDTVQSSVTYTLGVNLENLTLTGTAAINGTGNTLNNVITGNAANNTLDGGTGIDTLIGGLGNDTYSVDSTTDIITEAASAGSDTVQSSVTYTLGANLENLTLTGTAAINGTGNTLDNVISGNEANNIFNGSAGIDTLIGGAGDDTYSVDSATDTITEDLDAGSDTAQSSVTYTLGVNLENLTLTGIAAINGTGNTLDNVITGNGANNILDGGAGIDTLIGGLGNDTLIGGLGNDTYSVDSTTDIITEDLDAGSDTVQSSVTYTLGVNLENLTLTGIAAINGTGNTLDNVITGNGANNILDGGAGIDTLIGGAGIDILTGNAGADRFQFALEDSLLTAINTTRFSGDTITDYDFGTDEVDGPTPVTAANMARLTLTALDTYTDATISAALSTNLSASWAANKSALVTFGAGATAQTFLVLGDAFAGYQTSGDAVIQLQYMSTSATFAIV